MAQNTVNLLDVVALTVDLPEYNLCRGQVGTVVELLAGGAAFEVEFSDACAGYAYATDALMNLSVYAQNNLWCYISSQYHLIQYLKL